MKYSYSGNRLEAKYSPDQSRDDHGRFGEGSGGVSIPPKLGGSSVVSHMTSNPYPKASEAWHHYANGFHSQMALQTAGKDRQSHSDSASLNHRQATMLDPQYLRLNKIENDAALQAGRDTAKKLKSG